MDMALKYIFLALLNRASAEVFDTIYIAAKAGESVSIPVMDKDPGNASPDLCIFYEPLERRALDPREVPSSADEDGVSLVTGGERDSGWEFELAGSGVRACGIELNQVDKNDNGEWLYMVTGDDMGKIALTVDVVPNPEHIYFADNHNNEITELEVEIGNLETDVFCIIEGIRPAPEYGDIKLEISKCLGKC